MEKVYLTDRQVAQRYAIGRSTVWYWLKNGMLPQPVRFSENVTRWKLSSLEKFDDEREGGDAK